MALSVDVGGDGAHWNSPDPQKFMVMLHDTPEILFPRDTNAMARMSVDWKETATEHVFKADLSGLRKEDWQVQVEDGRTLSISGKRAKEEVKETDTWHRVERSSGQFMRKFRLPENTNLDLVTAKVDNGVLTVVVPKVEKKAHGTRSIEIGRVEQPATIAHNGTQYMNTATIR